MTLLSRFGSGAQAEQNIQADKASQENYISVEWSLLTEVLQSILSLKGPFHIDMFASQLNYKVKDYMAWRPDSEVKFIDAFFFNWKPYFSMHFHL